MGLPAKQEHRGDHRNRVLKGASILGDIDTSEVKCTIRNQSAYGAELTVPLGARFESEFLLYVPADKTGYKSVVRWRAGERVGVMFVGTAPKPHWHYG